MADGSRLVLKYKGALGNAVNFSFANVDEDVADENVKALSTGLITNGAIYADPPVTQVSAEVVTTSTREIDLD